MTNGHFHRISTDLVHLLSECRYSVSALTTICLKPSYLCQGIGVASPHQKYTTIQMSYVYFVILRTQVYAFPLASYIKGWHCINIYHFTEWISCRKTASLSTTWHIADIIFFLELCFKYTFNRQKQIWHHNSLWPESGEFLVSRYRDKVRDDIAISSPLPPVRLNHQLSHQLHY